MKYLLSILCILLSIKAINAQAHYNYSPDSSELSILFEKSIELDSVHSKMEVDLRDKWRYKKCKKVKIFVRGSYMLEGSSDTLIPLILTFKVSGKSFKRKIYSNKDYTEGFSRPGRSLYKKPSISISSQKLSKGNIIYVDAIDMSANKYPSKSK